MKGSLLFEKEGKLEYWLPEFRVARAFPVEVAAVWGREDC